MQIMNGVNQSFNLNFWIFFSFFIFHCILIYDHLWIGYMHQNSLANWIMAHLYAHVHL
jgi:hypothetical protein